MSGVQFPPWPFTPTITYEFHDISLAEVARLIFLDHRGLVLAHLEHVWGTLDNSRLTLEWAFIQPAQPVVLCLWHEERQRESDHEQSERRLLREDDGVVSYPLPAPSRGLLASTLTREEAGQRGISSPQCV